VIEVHLFLIVEATLVPSLPDVSREGEKQFPFGSLFDDVFVRPRLGVSFRKFNEDTVAEPVRNYLRELPPELERFISISSPSQPVMPE
jgi:hypothetical protein